jgi:hypothetical protein
MLRRAQDLRVHNPESIAWKKWYEQKKKDVEEYQARRFWKLNLLCLTVNKVIAKIMLIVCILYLQRLDAPATGKQMWLVLGTRRIGH